ncbi:hypothetical protein NM688_g8952 [Phlebia brevispora]|uniref:Uncharacterized protein n=1 Tax=Phlebia brevispora TaxID=194682 RepID=A0ACC1RL43_9APHY|nr:hypothetical protein NM688_g8952 [Phlebia brevispora]
MMKQSSRDTKRLHNVLQYKVVAAHKIHEEYSSELGFAELRSTYRHGCHEVSTHAWRKFHRIFLFLSDHMMKFFGSLFHPPASAEYTRPSLTNIQLVYKRIFDHLLDRGDSYKRDAFSALENARDALPTELYLKLRVDHDALSVQREALLDASGTPSTELIAKANSYKNAAKSLYWTVCDITDVNTRETSVSPSSSSASSSSISKSSAYTTTTTTTTSPVSSYQDPPPSDHVQHSHHDAGMMLGKTSKHWLQPPTLPIISVPRADSVERPLPSPPQASRNSSAQWSPNVRASHDLHEGVPFPVPIVPLFLDPDEREQLESTDFSFWLDNSLRSLDSSVDVHTVKNLLLSMPPEQMDDTCRRCFAEMMTDYGHVDGEKFMQEFVHKRLSSASSTPSAPRHSSGPHAYVDGNTRELVVDYTLPSARLRKTTFPRVRRRGSGDGQTRNPLSFLSRPLTSCTDRFTSQGDAYQHIVSQEIEKHRDEKMTEEVLKYNELVKERQDIETSRRSGRGPLRLISSIPLVAAWRYKRRARALHESIKARVYASSTDNGRDIILTKLFVESFRQI